MNRAALKVHEPTNQVTRCLKKNSIGPSKICSKLTFYGSFWSLRSAKLVGGLEHFLFSIIYGIILPRLISFKMVKTTNQKMLTQVQKLFLFDEQLSAFRSPPPPPETGRCHMFATCFWKSENWSPQMAVLRGMIIWWDIIVWHMIIWYYWRKFRSQTSDHMDRWKAEVGRVREEKRRRKKIKKEKVSEERRSRCAKRYRKVAKHSVFLNDLRLWRIEK